MFQYYNRHVLLLCILQTFVSTVSLQHGGDSNDEHSSRTISSHHHELRRGFIPNIEITDAYLRDHSPLMPLLEEESQKRTTLREKELNFYGHLNVDQVRSFSAKTTAKHSELKDGKKNEGNKTDDSKKAPYGR